VSPLRCQQVAGCSSRRRFWEKTTSHIRVLVTSIPKVVKNKRPGFEESKGTARVVVRHVREYSTTTRSRSSPVPTAKPLGTPRIAIWPCKRARTVYPIENRSATMFTRAGANRRSGRKNTNEFQPERSAAAARALRANAVPRHVASVMANLARGLCYKRRFDRTLAFRGARERRFSTSGSGPHRTPIPSHPQKLHYDWHSATTLRLTADSGQPRPPPNRRSRVGPPVRDRHPNAILPMPTVGYQAETERPELR